MIFLRFDNVIASYILPSLWVNRVCSAYIHDRVMLWERMPNSRKPIPRKSSPAKARSLKPASASPKHMSAPRPAAAKPYHHGDLRRVLIDAALDLAKEGGPEAVSVREAARRAGVSPGAPFRHFPSRDALMTAVAEEAQRRFRLELEAATARAPASDPLARFRSLGLGYLRWAARNPAHFEIISTGRLFDHDGAEQLTRDNAELIGMTERLLAQAFSEGALRVTNLKAVQIAGRALVYGFARMNIDGHFRRWGVADAEATGEAILDLFINGIARHPRQG
jgi:AcrR family transcriptional regulator